MNVLVISHMFPNDINHHYGSFVEEQCSYLAESNINIKLISPIRKIPFPLYYFRETWRNFNNIKKDTFFEKNKFEYAYIDYLFMPKKFLYEFRGRMMFYGSQNLIQKNNIMQDIDLIHAHVALPDGQMAMYLSKKYGTPYVVTIHGQDFQVSLNRKKWRNAIEEILRNATGIIFVSEKLENIYKKKFSQVNTKTQTKVIKNGYNPIFNQKKEIDHEKKELHLVSVCNLKKSKGIEYNLRAIKHLQNQGVNIKYTIIGSGTEKENLKQIIDKLKIDGVEFRGLLQKDKIAQVFSNADIFSLPSYSEGFGIAYLEALASGLPVISVDCEGITQYLPERIKMAVRPKNYMDIVEKIDNYRKLNETEKKELSNVCSNFAANNFSWEKNAFDTKNFYNEIL